MSSMTLGNVSVGLRTNADGLDRMDLLPQLAHHLRNAADAIDAHIAGMGEPVAWEHRDVIDGKPMEWHKCGYNTYLYGMTPENRARGAAEVRALYTAPPIDAPDSKP